MAALDMATVTKYLERSMQNCSLSNRRRSFEDGFGMTGESEEDHILISDRTLELNSHISLPCHLEQCLDLKTGEVYFINRNNGLKVKEDPRKSVRSNNADQFSGDSDVTVFSEKDSSYYESEESSSESSRAKLVSCISWSLNSLRIAPNVQLSFSTLIDHTLLLLKPPFLFYSLHIDL